VSSIESVKRPRQPLIRDVPFSKHASMRTVPSSAAPTTQPSDEVTVERLELAIKAVAGWIVNYDLRQAAPTLKRLHAERERLLKEGDPIEYAKRVLADVG
jgi:hypothetical protein